ncbi:transcription initiation at TATA-containing promoter protein [Umbelopsis nana]
MDPATDPTVNVPIVAAADKDSHMESAVPANNPAVRLENGHAPSIDSQPQTYTVDLMPVDTTPTEPSLPATGTDYPHPAAPSDPSLPATSTDYPHLAAPSDPSLPATSTDSPHPQPALPISKEQWQWCSNTLKSLKKNKSSGPFLEPVDIVKFNIPNYPEVVKHPMDLSTVQAKVSARQYATVDEFVSDVRLIFSNCYLFNGQDAPVSLMAAELEKAFDRAVYKIPSAAPVPAVTASVATSTTTKKSTPHVATSAKSTTKKESKDTGGMASDETKRCKKALDEMKKPQHNAIAWPFLLPVDPVAWNIVGYFDVVKRPMDISTVERKLSAGEYKNAAEFEADVRLIFHNCYIFNTPDNEVYQMGQALEAVFNEKWKKSSSSSSSSKKTMSAKEKRIEQLEEQLRRLKQQLNDQQDMQEIEEDEDDEDFTGGFAPVPSKRPRATSRRQHQASDEDDQEFAPKKRRVSKSFPAEKSAKPISPPQIKPTVPANAPALSKSPPPPPPQLNPLPGNRPKLALGATITALSPPPEKEPEKKPEIVLQNEDKWLALMRADAGSQPSSQTSAAPPASGAVTDAASQSANTSPAQDNQKVDPLWQKFQEERRLREEQEREARELVKRKEKERKEEEKKLQEQAEAAKRAKEEAEREKRRNYRRQLQEQARSWKVDLYKQKRMMERFERESWADSEWRDEMKRQQEAAESRRVIMPAFTLNTGLSLEQVKQAILNQRDNYEQRKREHGDERVVDMEME